MRFAASRAAQGVPLLLVIAVLVFALLHAVPGGPLAAYLENPNVRPEDIARLRAAMGLDRPLVVQYLSWLAAFVRGDWGYSLADGRPVFERLVARIPATVELVGASSLLAIALALPIGILAAVRRRFDRITSFAAVAGISLPVFWFGLVLQLVVAGKLGWLPSSGRASFGGGDLTDLAAHLVLPALVLALVQAAAWSRYLRRAMREVLGRPFIRAARARGEQQYAEKGGGRHRAESRGRSRRARHRPPRARGAVAGYAGRWVDDVLMLIGLVAIAGWMETARVVRAEVLSLKARDFVQAARAIGATPARVVVRHLRPGIVPAASVATTLAIGRGILPESTMSFFDAGVQPPTASWGNMLYQAQTTMTSEPWLAIFPGMFIFATVLACNAVGDVIGGRSAAKTSA